METAWVTELKLDEENIYDTFPREKWLHFITTFPKGTHIDGVCPFQGFTYWIRRHEGKRYSFNIVCDHCRSLAGSQTDKCPFYEFGYDEAVQRYLAALETITNAIRS